MSNTREKERKALINTTGWLINQQEVIRVNEAGSYI